jgi:hypothetical protein
MPRDRSKMELRRCASGQSRTGNLVNRPLFTWFC